MHLEEPKWMFPKIRVPQDGWFIMENPIILMDDLGVPSFLETPKYQNPCCFFFEKNAIHSLRVFNTTTVGSFF